MMLLVLMMIAVAIMVNPHYLTQQLNLFEWGLYLPGIEAVSQGQVPYRDFFHLRGPFELYAPAFFMNLFGFRADVLATYFYLGTMLTMSLAVLIAYELVPQRLLLYPFVLILVTRTFPRVVFTFWGGMRYAWGLLAVWCLVRFFKTKHRRWLLAGGCLAAIGAWTSIEIGLGVLMAFILAMALNDEYHRRARIFLAGFLIISVPYGIYLLSQNAWMPFLQAQGVVVTHMGKTFVQTESVLQSFSSFWHAVFFPLDKSFHKMTPMYGYMFFFAFYLWRLFHKKNVVLDQAALAVAVYGLMLFLTGLRNVGGAQFEMSLQPEKIILFYLLGQLIVWAKRRFAGFPWVAAALLAAVILSSLIYGIGRFKTRFYQSWKKAAWVNGSAVSLIDLPRIRHMRVPLWQAEDLQQLTRFVNGHVPAHEALWTYPELGSLNFILNRPWVGRFPMATLSWMDEGWFADYERALEQNPPRYAIVNKAMPFYFDKVYFLVPANRVKHERMMRFLHHHYMMETQTPTYLVFRRVH